MSGRHKLSTTCFIIYIYILQTTRKYYHGHMTDSKGEGAFIEDSQEQKMVLHYSPNNCTQQQNILQ